MENRSTTDPYATNRLATDPYATSSTETVSVTRTAKEGKRELATDLFATNPLAVETERDGVQLTTVLPGNHKGSEGVTKKYHYPEEMLDES
jgi:hypothetical protein